MIVKIIPDTNILIRYNELLDVFFSKKPNFLIYISRIVLNELDLLKKSQKNARLAVKFIKKYYITKYIQIEGHGCLEKMDIEMENSQIIQIEKNDDKIIKFAFDHSDFVLVTADRVMALNAVSYGVNVILDEKNSFDALLDDIYAYFGCLKSFSNTTNNIEEKENKKMLFKHNSDAFRIIVPDINTINEDENNNYNKYTKCKDLQIEQSIIYNEQNTVKLEQPCKNVKISRNVSCNKLKEAESLLFNYVIEIAKSHGLKTNKIKCFSSLLEFVLQHFSCYQSYLPNNCKSDLKKIRNKIVNENIDTENYKKNIRKLLVIFGFADFTIS